MNVFNAEESIEVINLSNYSKNTLYKLGINTIRDFAALKLKDLALVRNVGAKRLKEIDEMIKVINNKELSLIYDNSGEIFASTLNHYEECAKIFHDEKGVEYIDIPIRELDLSVRAYNSLIKNEYEYASELLSITEDDLNKMRNVGEKTRKEILEIKSSIVFTEVKDESDEGTLLIDKISLELISMLKIRIPCIDMGILILELRQYIKPTIDKYLINNYTDLIDDYLSWEEIFKIKSLREAIKKQIIVLLAKTRYGLSFENIELKLPREVSRNDILKQIICEMLRYGLLEYLDNGNMQKRFMTVEEYSKTLKSEKMRDCFCERITGKTLEEIGSQKELTRERVRQIVAKVINAKPRLREDYYSEVFQEYCFSEEEFIYGFNESKDTYSYLKLAYKPGIKGLNTLIDDVNYPSYIRKIAEKIVYKDYIYVEEDRVKRNRNDIVNYVMRKYCKEEVSFEEFEELYQMFLEDYFLEQDTELIINSRYYENRLADSDKVLWKQWKRFRYYDILAYDFDELLETLALEQYSDIEYSTKKFFCEFPVLMKQYDIRDEYELHTLLKKVYRKRKDNSIKFKKMPSMEFGNANRDNQVLDLLIQCAPISNTEFAKKYEEEYGVKAETVLANYMKNFDDYFYNGVYSIDAKILPYNELEILKTILVKDFYTISDIKRIYCLEFPDGDIEQINSYTLKTIGFLVYSGYVISNRYSSSVEYFKYILLGNDITNLTSYPKSLLNTVGFTSQLNKLKSDYSIIEFNPLQIITLNKLENIGISIDDIESYINKIKKFVRDGEFFTIYTLKKRGFSHNIDKWGFSDWFYSSILAQDEVDFSYRRMGKRRVFTRGKCDVTIKSFLEYIVGYKEKIDIYDLIELIEEEYGVKLDKDRVITVLKDSYLYYNSIMEKVYINYEVYFEEV